ncbi:hypothetical protein Nepgr_023646 [Nepenthes gracilis]|uniref:Uncharacterized protein n=1 Tax=Nepenthes gracilis TaxID=150966 RepID=A0AAD3T2I6_NEPGR|nr:hypothetical protein Nepgr_023646 [Nepenthes gracilis]
MNKSTIQSPENVTEVVDSDFVVTLLLSYVSLSSSSLTSVPASVDYVAVTPHLWLAPASEGADCAICLANSPPEMKSSIASAIDGRCPSKPRER